MIQVSHKSIKLALVEDHDVLRESLEKIINGFDSCRVILVAQDGLELIAKLQDDLLPDIVLLDLDMPRMDGFETAKFLQERYPSILVLVLTMFGSNLPTKMLLKIGARGVLQKKDTKLQVLRQAIETTMDTGYCLSGTQMAALIKQDTKPETELNNSITLTEKELCFLRLVAKNLTYKAIAREMKISPRTVDNYRESLFSKLDIDSKVGLVLYAIRNGLSALNN